MNWLYDLSLPGPHLEIADFAGVSDADPSAMRASFQYQLTLASNGGPPATVWDIGYELVGGIGGHVLNQTGADTLAATPFDMGSGDFGYDFDPLFADLTGSAAPGETITLVASLKATVVTPGFETGAAAWIGDPLDLGNQYSASLTLVPEPLSLALVGSTLLALATLRRRQAL
ncbi:MAG: PEP-CTERM sorting domain-containing protein [Nitrospirae bacterium]|nr:MAG: PEP-CTERM sorting domain-containing protein [Nitrospirota bacterium]